MNESDNAIKIRFISRGLDVEDKLFLQLYKPSPGQVHLELWEARGRRWLFYQSPVFVFEKDPEMTLTHTVKLYLLSKKKNFAFLRSKEETAQFHRYVGRREWVTLNFNIGLKECKLTSQSS